jgi:hypothetical protein
MSDLTYHEIEHAGLKIKFANEEYIDEFFDPRQCDQLGHMAVSYKGYSLGDEELPSDGLPRIDCPVCDGGEKPIYGPPAQHDTILGPRVEDEPECFRCAGYHEVEPTLSEYLTHEKAIAAMPLFVYEHSGITMKAGSFVWLEREQVEREDTVSRGRFIGDDAGWDTSFVGFIYTTHERCEELGVEETPENIEQQLRGEVSEYASYLEGDVTVYRIEDEDGNVLDSCGGFLGVNPYDEDNYVVQEAKHAAEACREEIEREKREAAEMAARDVITIVGGTE